MHVLRIAMWHTLYINTVWFFPHPLGNIKFREELFFISPSLTKWAAICSNKLYNGESLSKQLYVSLAWLFCCSLFFFPSSCFPIRANKLYTKKERGGGGGGPVPGVGRHPEFGIHGLICRVWEVGVSLKKMSWDSGGGGGSRKHSLMIFHVAMFFHQFCLSLKTENL